MFAIWVLTNAVKDRLDADFYRPEFLHCAKRVESYPRRSSFEALRVGMRPISYGVLKPEFMPEGTPLIRNHDFDPPSISLHGVAGISPQQSAEFRRSVVRSGDLLVTIGGYVGTAAIVPPSLEGANINQHVARISLRHEDADAYFYWAFIESSFGKMLLERWVSGTAQPGINLGDLKRLPIPWPEIHIQGAIGNKVRKAEHLREIGWAKWRAARIGLEVKLGIKLVPETFTGISPATIKARHLRCLSTDPAIVFAGVDDVLGAQYYHPRRVHAQAMAEASRNAIVLRKVATRISDNVRGARTDFIGLDCINSYTGIISKNGSQPMIEQAVLKEEVGPSPVFEADDILFSRLRPYLNKVSIWPRGFPSATGSGELLVYRSKGDIDPYYLFFVLKSPLGMYQVIDVTSGSTHPRVDSEVVDAILIPRLTPSDESSIGARVKEALTAWYEVPALITQARAEVEALVEGSIDVDRILDEGEDLQRWLNEHYRECAGKKA